MNSTEKAYLDYRETNNKYFEKEYLQNHSFNSIVKTLLKHVFLKLGSSAYQCQLLYDVLYNIQINKNYQNSSEKLECVHTKFYNIVIPEALAEESQRF